MQLLAVVVPPPDVAQEALDLARGLCEEPAPETEQPRGLGRLLRRTPAPPPPIAVLTPPPPGSVFVRVARLGNVMDADAVTLAGVVAEAARQWPAPVVHVSEILLDGVEVVGELGGDTDALSSIFRGLEATVRPHGFFLDRRAFRSRLALGTLDVPEGAALPAALAGGAADVRGSDWRADRLTFVRRVHRSGAEAFEAFESFALGG